MASPAGSALHINANIAGPQVLEHGWRRSMASPRSSTLNTHRMIAESQVEGPRISQNNKTVNQHTSIGSQRVSTTLQTQMQQGARDDMQEEFSQGEAQVHIEGGYPACANSALGVASIADPVDASDEPLAEDFVSPSRGRGRGKGRGRTPPPPAPKKKPARVLSAFG